MDWICSKIPYERKSEVRIRLFVHIAFWAFYVGLNFLINSMQSSPENFYVSEQLLKYAVPILVFYLVAFFIFPKLKLGYWLVTTLLLLSLILHYALVYLLTEIALPVISDYPRTRFFPKHFFLSGFWWWTHYCLYGWVYWYYHKSLAVQAQNFELTNQRNLLQYNYLKAQINPHFLYNTLAFFHSKAMQFSKETATGMELLSTIMRYSLQPATSDGMVPLKDEVEHLQNYIELHQIRYENALNINFKQTGNLDGMRVPPHILITLVENAFKHGVFSESEPPLEIELTTEEGHLHFSVTNKINGSRKGIRKEDSGIGLSNIQLRLEKEYGNKGHLFHKKENELFTVELNISAK
jgi:two-component system, LytTR family, sensor kinase